MKMKNKNKLLDKITVENVKNHIGEGSENSRTIAINIIGTNAWNPLPEWDRKKLTFNVHKIIVENKLLEK